MTRQDRPAEISARLERALERRQVLTEPDGSNIADLVLQVEALQARTADHAAQGAA